MKEWSRTDQGFIKRITNLKTGKGLNGSKTLLTAKDVNVDSTRDYLTSKTTRDWYFILPRDTFSGLDSDDFVN